MFAFLYLTLAAIERPNTTIIPTIQTNARAVTTNVPKKLKSKPTDEITIAVIETPLKKPLILESSYLDLTSITIDVTNVPIILVNSVTKPT